MKEFIVECEECESVNFVHSYEKIRFCPACGRRAEVEKRSIDIDDTELLLEDE